MQAAAIQATIDYPTTQAWIAGIARSLTVPTSALKSSSCLASACTSPVYGFPMGGTLFGAAAPPIGTRDLVRHEKIAPCAQIPMQREADRIHAPAASGGVNDKAGRVPVAEGTPRIKSACVEPDHDCGNHRTQSTVGLSNETCTQIPMQREAGLAKTVGTLRNGNPRGNPNAAPRCGAQTRSGCACRAPAMKNGRCRMHGGASTGPSAEGRARIAAARTIPRTIPRTIHGRRAAATRALDRRVTATKRRGRVVNAMARAGLRVEDLAVPIQQCRGGVLVPGTPSTPAGDRAFVMRELMTMAFSAAEVRSLLSAIGASAPKPMRRTMQRSAQIPIQREPVPKPPRQALVCERPRQPLVCRRLDPANPLPARAKAHATWDGDHAPVAGRRQITHSRARSRKPRPW